MFDSRRAVEGTFEQCRQIREGIGKTGDWAIDFYTRLDLSDAVRLSALIEALVTPVRRGSAALGESVRAEGLLAAEQGSRCRRRTVRRTVGLPRTRPATDYRLCPGHAPKRGRDHGVPEDRCVCETHYVGIVPHFTGPISLAALVHVLSVFSGPVLMEILGAAPPKRPYLPQGPDFRDGKLWPRGAHGLGVEFDQKGAQLIAEITERSRGSGGPRGTQDLDVTNSAILWERSTRRSEITA